MPSSQPPAVATSRRSSRCSTPTSCCDPTAALCRDRRFVRGAEAVAGQALMFADPSRLVRPALVNGAAGVVVTVDGRAVTVMGFTVVGGKIVAIDSLGDPERLGRLDLAVLDD